MRLATALRRSGPVAPNLGATLGEQERGPFADPAACARNDNDLVFDFRK